MVGKTGIYFSTKLRLVGSSQCEAVKPAITLKGGTFYGSIFIKMLINFGHLWDNFLKHIVGLDFPYFLWEKEKKVAYLRRTWKIQRNRLFQEALLGVSTLPHCFPISPTPGIPLAPSPHPPASLCLSFVE